MTRRTLFQASLAAFADLKLLANPRPQSPSQRTSVENNASNATFSNGMVAIVCDKRSGLANYSWSGSQKVKNAYSSVKLGEIVKTTDYTRHDYEGHAIPVHDSLGRGLRFTMAHTAENRPGLFQHFTLYEGKPFFLIQVEIRGAQPLHTNYMSPIGVESTGGVDIGTSGQTRALRVPFDNDMWIRYDSMDISRSGSGIGSEVTAVYDNASRNGLVFGSVTHNQWKTGIQFTAVGGRLDKFEIYGGMALETYQPPAEAMKSASGRTTLTRDSLPHGEISGESIYSPVVFAGFFEDWRNGLEEYGRANANFRPPLRWNHGIPFGWNSFAAVAGRLSYSEYLGAADFIARKLAPKGFNSDHVLYMNLDGGWGRALDPAEVKDAIDILRNLGQNQIDYRAGAYMAPFAYFHPRQKRGHEDPLNNFVEGTDLKYRYRDILLKKPDGSPLPTLDGSHPLDPTHPGTKTRIRTYISTMKELGFTYLKIDFLTHGALEGAHWDRSIKTGIEAYNQGMQYILDQVAGEMFISLSIAPIFPGGYGHARRISCDTMGHISLPPDAYPQQTTEYMLNSITYGWWTSPSIYIADPDQLPIGTGASIHGARNLNEARSRFLSAIVSGGQILDSSGYLNDPQARELAPQVYTNPRMNALAGGKPFRPLEGNTGDRAADVFVRENNGTYYVAIFNFSFDAPAIKQIPIDRIARPLSQRGSVGITDVWTNRSLGRSSGTLRVSIGPAESKLLRLD
ncbi:MAG: carbohydrate-binding protein [Bryobacteraceae bacterium]